MTVLNPDHPLWNSPMSNVTANTLTRMLNDLLEKADGHPIYNLSIEVLVDEDNNGEVRLHGEIMT